MRPRWFWRGGRTAGERVTTPPPSADLERRRELLLNDPEAYFADARARALAKAKANIERHLRGGKW